MRANSRGGTKGGSSAGIKMYSVAIKLCARQCKKEPGEGARPTRGVQGVVSSHIEDKHMAQKGQNLAQTMDRTVHEPLQVAP